MAQATLQLAEHWDPTSHGEALLLTTSYEHLAERAPSELSQLKSLPRPERLALWTRLTMLPLGILATRASAIESPSLELARIERNALDVRLQRAVARLLELDLRPLRDSGEAR